METVPPKIIRVRNSLYKDNSTLFWAKDQDVHAAKWKRWDAVVTSISDYMKWKDYTHVVALILTTISEEDKNILEREIYNSNVNMYIFLFESVFYVDSSMELLSKKNTYLLKDLLDNSPYITPKWDNTLEDACACLTIYNRYKQLIDCHGISMERQETMRFTGIGVNFNIQPPLFYVMTQYFIHKQQKRAKEIRKCLEKNCENQLVDKIILLNEEDHCAEWKTMKGSEKIQQIVVGKRLTYAMFLEHTYKSVPYNTIIAYANADIYFDNSIMGLYNIKLEDRMLALLRWDTDIRGSEPKLFGPHSDSQDTWIVFSDSIKTRKWDYSQFEYTLGKAGCDNRFTFDMFKNRFVIFNPAYSIKSLHIHTSEIRNYNKTDIIPSSHYIFTYPSPILEYNQISIIDKTPIDKIEDVEFTVKIQSLNKKNGTTWCTMLARRDKYKWSLDTPVKYKQDRRFYSWKNCNVINSGIVFDGDRIYLGPNFQEFNEQCTTMKDIDFYGKKPKCEKVFAIPVASKEVFENIDLYILYYMSKVYSLLDKYDTGKFWISEGFSDEMKQFTTSTGSQMHCIPWDYKSTAFGEEVIGFYPSIQPFSFNDIYQLRAHKHGFLHSINQKTCVILIDNNSSIDSVFADQVIKHLGSDWIVQIMNANESGAEAYNTLHGQSLCIFFGGPKMNRVWSKLWALPPGASVIEFQNELKIDGEFQYFAGCAKFDSWILTLHKGSQAEMRENAFKQFCEWHAQTFLTDVK
jgi:hypothetical protein